MCASHFIKPENGHLYEQFITSGRALIRDIDRYSERAILQKSVKEFKTSSK